MEGQLLFNRVDNQPQQHTNILFPANPAETPLTTPAAGPHVNSRPLTPSNRADCVPQANTERAGGQLGRCNFVTHVIGLQEQIEQAERTEESLE